MRLKPIILCIATMLFVTTQAEAKLFGFLKKKKTKGKTEVVAKPKEDKFTKETKGATRGTGVFNYWLTPKGELLFEVNKTNLETFYLLANRVSEISQNSNFVAGQMIGEPFMFRMSADTAKVYLHTVNHWETVRAGDPIEKAFRRNVQDPILKSFSIRAQRNDTLLVDMTKFFVSNEKCITPIQQSVTVPGKIAVSYDSEGSKLKAIKGFEKNIEITSILNYIGESGGYTVTMRRSILELPKDPMPIRYQDNRVGYFSSKFYTYTSDKDKLLTDEFIHRWRIEPKKEDVEKYFRGELVEPQNKIVFYVDDAFPDKWRGAVKKGIEDWNVAFAAAGFKNVVEARDYPQDSLFDPDDIRYNCVRYAITDIANAMGPSYTDPRTGEILVADVIWYHNVLSLVHNWRFAQTGAVDPRVRKPVFDDDVMSESLRYVAAHEIGHTVGLMHNMGASYSYPVDSLRSVAFTRKYGTTPSIMDYARNNYIAQKGDFEKGVSLVPPLMGVYDVHAINWGYRLFDGVNDPKAELPLLNDIIKAKGNDPMYEFGAQQIFITLDPTDQSEDLGNDHIAAGNYGIQNAKYIVSNLTKWFHDENADYKEIATMYGAVVSQYMRYLTHVMPYLGGVQFKDIVQDGSSNIAKKYIPKDVQRKAMYWLVDQAVTSPKWLLPKDMMFKLGYESNYLDNFQSAVAGKIFNPGVLGVIYEGERSQQPNTYKLDEYLQDALNSILAATIKGKTLTLEEMNLQGAATMALIRYSGLVPMQGEAISMKGLSAPEDAYNALMSFVNDQSQSFCSHSSCRHTHEASADNGDKSYYRHEMSQGKLSAAVGYPSLTSALRKMLNIYKSNKNTGDARTRAFYDFQIIKIERAFNRDF